MAASISLGYRDLYMMRVGEFQMALDVNKPLLWPPGSGTNQRLMRGHAVALMTWTLLLLMGCFRH